MELQSIREVTKELDISTRTLRYYEAIGLIQSERTPDYAYRMYNEDAVLRIRQIVILRKLRVSLKQIKQILENQDAAFAVEVFRENIADIDEEISALQTVRDILAQLAERLQSSAGVSINKHLFADKGLLATVQALGVPTKSIEEETSMKKLKKAEKKLNRLTDNDVRIVYLPPMTVASVHKMGGEPGPETESGKMLFDFIKANALAAAMPGFRHFGFNNPDEPVHGDGHGYERWVTIPDDWTVAEPFVKKHFAGGLYVARTIPMGAWDEWMHLHAWVSNSKQYDFRWGTLDDGEGRICGWLEEHLDAPHHYLRTPEENEARMQIDLLIPLAEK